MKRKRILGGVLVVILMLALVACAANDVLAGTTWKPTGAEVKGIHIEKADIASMVGNISFQRGGLALLGDPGGEEGRAHYAISDGVVTITDLSGSMSATLDESEMQFVQVQDGVTITLIFTKQ